MDDLNNYVDNPLDLCKMIIEEKQNEYGDAWQDHCSKEEIETLERYWGKLNFPQLGEVLKTERIPKWQKHKRNCFGV